MPGHVLESNRIWWERRSRRRGSSSVSNPGPYLDENSFKIRSKPVPWEGYPLECADLGTSEELALRPQASSKRSTDSPDQRQSIFVSDGQIYALLYLRLLKKLQRVDTVTMQCLLVLMPTRSWGHAVRPQPALLAPPKDIGGIRRIRAVQVRSDLHHTPLLRVHTAPTPTPTAIPQGPRTPPFRAPHQTSATSRCNVSKRCWPLQIAAELSGVFLASLQGMPSLRASSLNLLFSLSLLLTFEQDVAVEINKWVMRFSTRMVAVHNTEKVIRVIVATFRNLITKAPSASLAATLVAQLLPFSKNLPAHKFSDEDILEDVQFVRDELKCNFENLT
ncbi:hypothetical protein OG21DRAFT_1488426 [Imleria badia]|nr:hypothetical protein OG21DRAFT_1488426 [Imleria badia]